MALERLQKILAQAGVASRRASEELITRGRVRVDGRVVSELGAKADPRRSKIELDGRQIHAEPFMYIILHKPRGVMCTLSDPEGRPTIAELVREVPVRLTPVGRLDYNTSGALLMTNDGEFSSKLQHPSGQAAKVYVAKVDGELSDNELEPWRRSILVDGKATQPASVRRLRWQEGKTWLEVTLREGRHRQIRRLGEEAGNPVMRLARLSQAGITTDDLRPGQWRHLTVDELTELKRKYGVPKKVRAPRLLAEPTQTRPVARGSRPSTRAATSRHAATSRASAPAVRGGPKTWQSDIAATPPRTAEEFGRRSRSSAKEAFSEAPKAPATRARSPNKQPQPSKSPNKSAKSASLRLARPAAKRR